MCKVLSPSQVNQVILSARKTVRVLNDGRGRWGASSASVGLTDHIEVDAVCLWVQIRELWSEKEPDVTKLVQVPLLRALS